MNDALALLADALEAEIAEDARQSAVDVARACWDFRLRYQTQSEIDIARFELLARQVLIDAGAGEPADVKGDAASLEWTRDRFIHTLTGADAAVLNSQLSALRSAANSGNFVAASAAAEQLRNIIAELGN